MANGHDNVLSVTLQDDQPHVEAGGFDGFLRDEYRGLVQFLRRRTATEQDAEDAAQESLTRLLRYKESEPASAWKPLLYRIATNVAHDQSRVVVTHRADKHVSLENQEVAAEAPTPEQQAVRDQEIAQLTRAILQLPPKCQRVYLLKRVHDLSRAQIAERCGISVKMVEKHLATALVQLRRGVGGEVSGAF
ncbi:RNA polymerase subunit sigma [Pseudoxanthomonas yeongjuensis]|uniref:RNA polymerase sigma factor n=1 Tax=Pseudoxanthomonas yeongjuensis TaxID=377616 RepID=UPI001391AB1B|nr:RNA polymerase sigma factor [Pseudoxanthomonas yeongjuensis]KAF1716830.1 RNA polymerase subunit sigma [Pseudoxanthomonas yeongjuensis]